MLGRSSSHWVEEKDQTTSFDIRDLGNLQDTGRKRHFCNGWGRGLGGPGKGWGLKDEGRLRRKGSGLPEKNYLSTILRAAPDADSKLSKGEKNDWIVFGILVDSVNLTLANS